jgi:hypothetical protein
MSHVTAVYHMHRLLSVAFCAMAVLWASDNQWRDATICLILFLCAHVLAERLYRRTA